ncbi:hypothetical protein B0T25DRAFT_419797, partial [Lasiosphaeria hispida]
SFSLFSLLPAELRLAIWRQSCHPRVVEVRYSPNEDRCLTTTKPPVTLHVCRESRYEGLRLYTRAFGTKTHEPFIYFAPDADILYVPRWGDMGYADTARYFGHYVLGTAEHVHCLAIDHVNPEIRRPWETYSKFCLMRNFPHLRETLLILSDDHHGHCEGQIEFVDPRGDQEDVMQVMENVRESFCCELGPDYFDWKRRAGEETQE